MFTNRRIAIAVALVSVVAMPSCTPGDTLSSAGRAPATAKTTSSVTIKNDSKPNKDCWWFRIGKSESVAVWVSPRLAGEVKGGFRFVNLFFHDPTCARPMAVFGGVACLDRSDPMSIGNASLEFAVAPVAGKNWADVAVRDDLVVKLERL